MKLFILISIFFYLLNLSLSNKIKDDIDDFSDLSFLKIRDNNFEEKITSMSKKYLSNNKNTEINRGK